MACNPLQPISCLPAAISAGAKVATSAAGNSLADAIRDGATWVVKTTIGWWIDVPAIDLAASPATRIRGFVLWLAVVVALAGVIWQGILMAVSRRPEPVFTVVRGLFVVALWTSVSIAGPAAALHAGDAFSRWVLDEAARGQVTQRLVTVAGIEQITSPGAVIVVGLVMILAGLVQAVLMMFREAAVIVLAGVVVLAASGTMMGATRPWLPRVLGWMLALICYKPAAALVYATALILAGDSNDPRSVLMGVAMMVLAVIALPALMRLFTWTTGAVASGGGGAASLAGAAAAGLHGTALVTGNRTRDAQGQADVLRTDLGPADGPPPSDPPGGGGGGRAPTHPSPPPSAAPAAPAPPRPASGSAPSTAAPPVAPTGGAAPTPTTAGAAAGATGTTAAAASSTSPWLAAAAQVTEAARRAREAAADAAQTMTRKDQP